MAFNINEYRNSVKRYGHISSDDINTINHALPNTKRAINRPSGTMYVSYDYTQLQKVMYHLTESGMREMFLNASVKATTIGRTIAKDILRSFDPNYSSMKPQGGSKGLPYALKRNSNPPTNRSIYRLVAENLNYQIDDKNGNVIGFVGEDLGSPLIGSRGGYLGAIIEKSIKKKTPKMPTHTPVMAGFNYLDSEIGNQSGDFKPSTYKVGLLSGIVGTEKNKRKKSRKSPEFKMQSVKEPRQVPLLNPWSKATLMALFDEFMGQGLSVWR